MQRVGEASSSPGAVDSAFCCHDDNSEETAQSDRKAFMSRGGKLFCGASPCQSVPHVSHFDSFNSI